jgi:hypothetical protein
MATYTITEFTDRLNTQFEELGVSVKKTDTDLEWQFYQNNTLRAGLEVKVYQGIGGDFWFRFAVYTLDVPTGEDDAENHRTGFEQLFDTFEPAVLDLIKKISQIRRELA